MERLRDINEALLYLKDKEVLTNDGKTLFVYKRSRVFVYSDGSSYSLEPDEFRELFSKTVFYLYEDNSSEIDQEKDEAYYRYYRK